MREKRYLGIDLHCRRLTCCVRLASGRNYLSEWTLDRLSELVKKQRPTDEVAVEVTGNKRLFYEAVAPHVERVVVVDPNQFHVIGRSVKKTDPNDARARRGTAKAIIALARKFLGIIYHTLKNNWVFDDFPSFVLAEAKT